MSIFSDFHGLSDSLHSKITNSLAPLESAAPISNADYRNAETCYSTVETEQKSQVAGIAEKPFGFWGFASDPIGGA